MRTRTLVVILLGVMVCSLVVLGSIPRALAQDTDRDEAGAANQADVDAAKEVKEKYEASLLSTAGVLGVGVGLAPNGRVGIVVFVQKGAPRPALPSQADGVPITVIESGGFVAHDGPCDAGACHEDVENLPVRMGTSTGNVNGIFAGTLGYRVRRIGDIATSEVGYITNNHVASASGGALCPAQLNPANLPAFGLDQCQPGLLDAPGFGCVSPRIGDLVQVVPLVMGGAFLNTVDAAFVRSNRACVSRNIRDIGNPSSSVNFPKLGTTLKLSGRSSGLRLVKVTAVNVTVDVFYGGAWASLGS